MGPVEEIRFPFGVEKEEVVSKAAEANFESDRETNPILSYPNSINN